MLLVYKKKWSEQRYRLRLLSSGNQCRQVWKKTDSKSDFSICACTRLTYLFFSNNGRSWAANSARLCCHFAFCEDSSFCFNVCFHSEPFFHVCSKKTAKEASSLSYLDSLSLFARNRTKDGWRYFTSWIEGWLVQNLFTVFLDPHRCCKFITWFLMLL